MLEDQHADRRQLADLMTPQPAGRPLLVFGELVPAAAARRRVALDDLVDLVLRGQPPTAAAMPVLGALLARWTSPASSSLAFACASSRRC